MKLSTIISSAFLIASSLSAPVTDTDKPLNVPQEAILGYLDLGNGDDVAIVPFSNSTSSGLLFVNTTIVETATSEKELNKREADAWHWITLKKGQPIYKREAEAEADAWHWITLNKGQPIYKRDPEAEADAWHWITLKKGQPIY